MPGSALRLSRRPRLTRGPGRRPGHHAELGELVGGALLANPWLCGSLPRYPYVMEETRRQRIDLVWAAVFVSCIATVALALLFTFASGATLDTVIAIDLVRGWILSVIAVVLLLTLPIEGKGLLALGRIVIWLALLTLLLAGGLGTPSIASVG